MLNDTSGIRDVTEDVTSLISNFYNIRVSLRDASIATVAAVITAIIDKDISTRRQIQDFLADHDCRFLPEVVDFILDAYDGRELDRHLWRQVAGRYETLV